MSDQKAAKAAEKKAEKEAAIVAMMDDLRGKHPDLNDAELRRVAQLRMRRAALDRMEARVMNPRVNTKAETRRKVILGAMLLDEMSRSQAAAQLVSAFVSRIKKDTDKKLFAEIKPGHDLIGLLRSHILPESVQDALANQNERFTLTFRRDPDLVRLLSKLVPAQGVEPLK